VAARENHTLVDAVGLVKEYSPLNTIRLEAGQAARLMTDRLSRQELMDAELIVVRRNVLDREKSVLNPSEDTARLPEILGPSAVKKTGIRAGGWNIERGLRYDWEKRAGYSAELEGNAKLSVHMGAIEQIERVRIAAVFFDNNLDDGHFEMICENRYTILKEPLHNPYIKNGKKEKWRKPSPISTSSTISKGGEPLSTGNLRTLPAHPTAG
jgi:hypothetical protein